MKSKRSLFVGACLLVLAAGAMSSLGRGSLGATFRRWGWPIYDSWQRFYAKPAPKDLAVILITQRSLDEFRDNPDLKLGWPWPREVYGAMVDTAGKLDAKSIVFDLVYDSPSVYGKSDDESFSQALGRFLAIPGRSIVFPAPTVPAFQKPNPTILGDLDSKLRYGAVNLPVEDDGVYRRVPSAFVAPDGRVYPALGSAAILEAPVSASASEDLKWLRFYSMDSIPTVDASEVFRLYQHEFHKGPLDDETKRAAETLRNKHWMIGLAAAGLYDLRPLPTDARAPGVFLHATSFLGESAPPLSEASWKIAISVFLSWGMVLVCLSLMATRPGPALLGAVATLFLGLPLTSWALWPLGVWLNPLPTMLGLGVMLAAFLFYRFQTEWRERERLAKSIENSMSSSMVRMIRSGELQLARFGERRTISILFSDLSGFTSLSEQTDPARLVEILNLYLDECVDLVFLHEGYVDKFIGDAIMALWGAPVLGQTDHAKRALRAALDYEEAVRRFNRKAREIYGFDRDLFIARVGLHSGPAIVGNIGSRSRHNYTAIGDSVNLASRLEGLGKYYDVTLLISEDALREAGALDSKELYLIDRVAVKGRSSAIAIYGCTRGIPEEQIALYRFAFESYQKQEWKKAAEALAQASRVPPSQILLERCQRALAHGEVDQPLRQLKNGVWHHDEK